MSSSRPPDDEQILFVVRRGVVGRPGGSLQHLAGGPDSARGPAPQDSPLEMEISKKSVVGVCVHNKSIDLP